MPLGKQSDEVLRLELPVTGELAQVVADVHDLAVFTRVSVGDFVGFALAVGCVVARRVAAIPGCGEGQVLIEAVQRLVDERFPDLECMAQALSTQANGMAAKPVDPYTMLRSNYE